jgi:hypothetical protein
MAWPKPPSLKSVTSVDCGLLSCHTFGIIRTKPLAIAGNVLLVLASLIAQHFFTRPDQEWIWQSFLVAFLIIAPSSAIVALWPQIGCWRERRSERGASPVLDIGHVQWPKPPKRGKPRRLHRTPIEQIAFWQNAKERLGFAYTAGKAALSGHDNQVQDEWARKTQTMIFETFGQAEAMVFLEPPEAPPPTTGPLPRNDTERRTHSETVYVLTLIERADKIIADNERLRHGYQEYPAVRYHATKPPVTVANAEEDARLGDEWADTPDAFNRPG